MELRLCNMQNLCPGSSLKEPVGDRERYKSISEGCSLTATHLLLACLISFVMCFLNRLFIVEVAVMGNLL